jgi:DNA (cytosine-5)-methyltransferase 1
MGVSRRKGLSLTAVDIFAGCGGLTEGLKRAGFRVLGAVEIDQAALDTYEANHPNVKTWHIDIRKLKARTICKYLRIRKRQLDLLAGCPPCQGFSTLRTLNGKRSNRDSRNDLLFEFLRFVDDLRPKAVMLENVPGLAQTNGFKRFQARMRALGYMGEYKILNAADYGVAQRRRRLIYVASLSSAAVFGKRSTRQRTVRDVIQNLKRAGSSGDPIHDLPERRSQKVKERIKRVSKDGGNRSDLPHDYRLKCHVGCDGFRDVYGRMAWDEVAPTITTGCFNPSKGRFLHPVSNRCITIREAALLQGFPKGYRFHARHGKVTLAQMIGNALPPPFIAAHARAVRSALTCTHQRAGIRK